MPRVKRGESTGEGTAAPATEQVRAADVTEGAGVTDKPATGGTGEGSVEQPPAAGEGTGEPPPAGESSVGDGGDAQA